MDTTQLEKIRTGRGFFAALDQSGGSTPKALAEYGVEQDRYRTDAEMFDLVHAMRTRVLTSPAFDGARILAAILFEQTMDRDMHGKPTGAYLWQDKHVVPFLKVDKGLAPVVNSVQLMKPIDTLDDLLKRGVDHGMFGTKMRSVIKDDDEDGDDEIEVRCIYFFHLCDVNEPLVQEVGTGFRKADETVLATRQSVECALLLLR